MKKLFIPAIALILLASCEKTVTVHIPESDPKLVISSRVETGDPVVAMIGKSRNILHPINNQDDYLVKDALVVLLENNIAIDTLQYDPASQRYFGSDTIRTGMSYVLRAAAPGFTEVLAASAAPAPPQIADITRVRNARTSSAGDPMDEIIVKINDPAGERNFYLIEILRAPWMAGDRQGVGCVSTTDKDIEQIAAYSDPFSSENCYDSRKLLMSDAYFNGSQKTIRFFVYSHEMNEIILPGGGISYPFIRISHITEAEFRFIKSYEIYLESSGNPFAEPVNVFSNVQNGYGIFGISATVTETLQ